MEKQKKLNWIRGNTLELALPLHIVYLTEEGKQTQDYTPKQGDVIRVILDSNCHHYEYIPTVKDGNVLHVIDDGRLQTGIYAITVTITNETENTNYRSKWKNLIEVYDDNEETVKQFDDFPEWASGAVIEGNIFFSSVDTTAYHKPETGIPVSDLNNEAQKSIIKNLAKINFRAVRVATGRRSVLTLSAENCQYLENPRIFIYFKQRVRSPKNKNENRRVEVKWIRIPCVYFTTDGVFGFLNEYVNNRTPYGFGETQGKAYRMRHIKDGFYNFLNDGGYVFSEAILKYVLFMVRDHDGGILSNEFDKRIFVGNIGKGHINIDEHTQDYDKISVTGGDIHIKFVLANVETFTENNIIAGYDSIEQIDSLELTIIANNEDGPKYTLPVTYRDIGYYTNTYLGYNLMYVLVSTWLNTLTWDAAEEELNSSINFSYIKKG